MDVAIVDKILNIHKKLLMLRFEELQAYYRDWCLKQPNDNLSMVDFLDDILEKYHNHNFGPIGDGELISYILIREYLLTQKILPLKRYSTMYFKQSSPPE